MGVFTDMGLEWSQNCPGTVKLLVLLVLRSVRFHHEVVLVRL